MPVSDFAELQRLSIWGRFSCSLDKVFVNLGRGYFTSDCCGVAPLLHRILVSNIEGPVGVSACTCACEKGFESNLKIECRAVSNPTPILFTFPLRFGIL